MIPKSGYRFSEKIMLHQKALAAGGDGKALASPRFAGSGGGDMPEWSKSDGRFHPPRPRAQAPADASYTRKLLNQGVAECAKKLGEEAIETVIAAVGKDRGRLIAETADLIYHLLVVLAARGITLAEVEAELAARTRQSGLQEKASRKGGSGPAPAARKIKTRLRQPKAREQGRAGKGA
jgi:phosphoribosyl-ATP pyrophosphohydrolase